MKKIYLKNNVKKFDDEITFPVQKEFFYMLKAQILERQHLSCSLENFLSINKWTPKQSF